MQATDRLFCPRSISTASDRRRTRGVEAPGTADWAAVCADARKTPPQGDARRFGEPPNLAAQGQSFSRKTVAEVPLAGLSFGSSRGLHGRGGPWHDSAVEAGRSSDPYLMGGYDRKRMELSHDCMQPVRVTIEIDPTGDWQSTAVFTYR